MPAGNSSAGGTFMIPMKARYYQTGTTITPGDANGIVTFSLIYDWLICFGIYKWNYFNARWVNSGVFVYDNKSLFSLTIVDEL